RDRWRWPLKPSKPLSTMPSRRVVRAAKQRRMSIDRPTLRRIPESQGRGCGRSAFTPCVRVGRWLFGSALLSALDGGRLAHAHVKWFADYDLTKPPLPIGEVLTRQFAVFFLSSVLLIYGFFWFDRFVLRKRFLEAALYRYVVTESQAFLM